MGRLLHFSTKGAIGEAPQQTPPLRNPHCVVRLMLSKVHGPDYMPGEAYDCTLLHCGDYATAAEGVSWQDRTPHDITLAQQADNPCTSAPEGTHTVLQ